MVFWKRGIPLVRYVFIRFAAILVVLGISSILLVNFYFKHFYFEKVEEDLHNYIRVYSDRIFPEKEGYLFNRQGAEKGGHIFLNFKSRLTIIQKSGKVLYDSHKEHTGMENHSDRPEIISALTTGKGVSYRYSATLEKKMLYVAVKPLSGNTKAVSSNSAFNCIIRASRPLAEMQKTINALNRNIIVITFFLLLIAFVLIHFLTRRFKLFLRSLITATEKLSARETEVPPENSKINEFQALSSHFENMARRIRKMLLRNIRDKEILSGIINTIKEGILVFDWEGRLIYINKPVFDKLQPKKLSQNTIEKNTKRDLYYWEIFTDIEFTDFIENVIKSEHNLTTEKKINGITFQINAIFLHTNKYFFFFFTDMSEKERLKQTKKDFVTNVSHELKTPLTTISGFVEAMLEKKGKDIPLNYLTIMDRSVSRMFNLIKDIVSLAELENAHSEIIKSKVNLKKMIDDIYMPFEQRLLEKGIRFKNEIPENFTEINADLYQLEQVFINLLENSLKYGDPKIIEIAAHFINNTATVTVSDDGIGIPEKDLENIFERFYVVDRSRSRASGGTGLGLSIVKHIIRNHDGTITATPGKNGGITFTITLPAYTETLR